MKIELSEETAALLRALTDALIQVAKAYERNDMEDKTDDGK